MINKEAEKAAREIGQMSDAEFESIITAQIEAMQKTMDKLKNLKLNQSPGINCSCPNEIKTGTVAIHCCNLCGKPDETWWR